ncbi:DHA2 family efflux MFS transporter permease subunit [Gryllotalpicola kribbensis]|uniref:DHA2 family efflux MFS transporter permease subunit n=1 Tax=Gryllotalpicola kribbensis TaxID=993084 RepID=A0ABP8AT52_9MICO
MTTAALALTSSPLRRNLAVVSILLSTLMATIDTSIVNVALPQLTKQLAVPPSETVWVATAFLLAVACAVPATSALGDQVGRRRLYLVGVPVFTLASLGCALSPTLGWLVAFRVVQGLGSAVILAVALPLFRNIFPPEKLGQIFGINAMTVALGTSIGPTLGGVILQGLSWPWLFLINVPIGAVAFVLAIFFVPGRTRQRGDYDTQGALFAAFAIACFLIGVRQLAALSTLWQGVVLLIAAGFFTWLFIRRERRAVRPLIPLGLFTGVFSLTVGTAWVSFLGQGIAFIALPFLFQSAYGASPLESALLFTPWPLVIVIVAPLSGRVADRVRPAYLAVTGLVILTIGLAMCALLGSHPPIWLVLVSTAVCGLGFGTFQSPNNRDMMAAAPLRYAASASAVLNTNRTVGQSAGAAAVSMALVLSGAAAGSVTEQAAAATTILWVAVAAGAGAAILSAVKLRATTPA